MSDSQSIPGGWGVLRMWAESFHDLQKTRIATGNRVGKAEGFDGYLAAFEALEEECRKSLVRSYREVVPADVQTWAKGARGVGDPTLARFLGHLGHPAIATPYAWMKEPPAGHECDPQRCGADRHLVAGELYVRTLRQLWAYCGIGDASRRRVKGMSADDATALGNPNLKTLAYLMAEATMKSGKGHDDAHYRNVYEARRLATADRLHEVECVRCGPSGRPAQPGTPWSGAHQLADALRIVAKEIVRDVWQAAGGGQIAQAPKLSATAKGCPAPAQPIESTPKLSATAMRDAASTPPRKRKAA